MGTKSFPSIREAFAKVRREECQKKVMINSFSTSENNTQNLALATSKLKTLALLHCVVNHKEINSSVITVINPIILRMDAGKFMVNYPTGRHRIKNR